MTWDEPRGKDDDGDKKRPFKCCSCRSTREHRCYKCFCGKCPAYTKKVPQRYGVKNQLPDSWPSNSSSKLGRNKETIVSGQSRRTDTSPKQQSVETSDPRSGDEHRPGFSSNPCTLRCWPAIRSGTRANGAEEKCSKAIALNSRAESGSSSRPSIEKERRGNDEVEDQKVTTNEGDGVSSKAHTGSSSNWEALTEKELRGPSSFPFPVAHTQYPPSLTSAVAIFTHITWTEPVSLSHTFSTSQKEKGKHDVKGNDEVGNQKVTTKAIEGGSSKSHDGSSSVWDALVEKQLRASRNQTGWANKAGSASSWVTWRVNGSRDNAAGTASSWGTWRVNEPREKDEVGNQKVTANEVESGSSKSHDESSSNWNALAGKALNGTETGWANKSGSASNWSTWRVNGSRNYTGGSASSHGTWRVNEPRGSGKVMANQAQGRSSKPVSLRPLVKSDSRWTSYTGKRSRGDQERGTNRIEDVSSRPWKMPRGRHQIVAYTNKDGSSEPGKQEVKDSRDEGGSYKSISHSAPSRSNSSWDAYTVKDARYNDYSISRNHEIMAYSAENGSSVPVLHSPNAGFISIPPSLHNPEETIYRAEDGSSKQVLRNHHAQSGSSGDALTVKEPSGNQEIMSYKAENGSSLPVLSNNAGFVSTPLSLTSKEPTGRSISEKESIKDGQHDVTILSKKLESIVRVDKKFTHPAVASLRYAKPPPSALSGKSYSPQNLARVGPASRVLWTGHIELLDTDNRMFEVFLAHSAAKVSLKAYKFAAQMADVLQFKIHPRRAFWPKIFQLGCPDARDVALYFYPERSGGSKQKYRELLKLLEHQDLMLRSVMGQVELLVFSSKLLSSKYQVLNGCIFMWGVFRKFGSNEVSCSAGAPPTPHLELAQAIANAT